MLRSFPNIVKQILMPVLPNLADLRFRYETCFISVIKTYDSSEILLRHCFHKKLTAPLSECYRSSKTL
jgi:hypothetical protein